MSAPATAGLLDVSGTSPVPFGRLVNVELRKTLKGEGLLSRDARIKERKKYGQKGARKRFQFSKR